MRRLPVVALLSLCASACTSTGDAPNAKGAELANVRGQTLSDECPNGGVDIELGIDENADGQLSDEEVDRVVTVCNGENGAEGDIGPQGPPGPPGPTGGLTDGDKGDIIVTDDGATWTIDPTATPTVAALTTTGNIQAATLVVSGT
ncbi:MAG: DUF7151 family protein, partial [Myxococcota bacterium]